MTSPSLENWDLKPIRAMLRHQMKFVGVKNFSIVYEPCDSILHINTFPIVQNSCQLDLVCKSYASHKLTYQLDHQGTSGCHLIPHTYGDIHVWTFNNIIEYPKPYQN